MGNSSGKSNKKEKGLSHFSINSSIILEFLIFQNYDFDFKQNYFSNFNF